MFSLIATGKKLAGDVPNGKVDVREWSGN